MSSTSRHRIRRSTLLVTVSVSVSIAAAALLDGVTVLPGWVGPPDRDH